MKLIFVTGGVVSSLGKGIVTASLASLLRSRGIKLKIRKLDPYLNVDPGTMSPYQHGEVYVTDDGYETDLDLGHYERFTDITCSKNDSISSGKIYSSILSKERKGEYLGSTVQVIPHVTEEIKNFIKKSTNKDDVIICEIGGTVGDIESLPFLEAIRQFKNENHLDTLLIHLTLLPYIETSGEVKTKPTQHSVRELLNSGIQPDIIVCRSNKKISKDEIQKISLFCNVPSDSVIPSYDVESIYQVPNLLSKSRLDDLVIKKLHIKSPKKKDLTKWINFEILESRIKEDINIFIIGKYVHLKDSYKSLYEAIYHAGVHNKANVVIKWLDSETINSKNVSELLKSACGVLIPGGFGNRGINGKIEAIKFAREYQIPFLGICLGMQLSIIEFAKNVLKIKNAGSSEFGNYKNNLISLMTEWDFQNKKIIEKIKFCVEHNATNFMAAIGAAIALDFSQEEFKLIKNFDLKIPHRLEFINTNSDVLVIDDCYNANPSSMKKAIDVLSKMGGHKIALIGDMAELGERSEKYHQDIINYLEEKKIDLIFRIGGRFKNIKTNHENNFWFPSKESLIESLKKQLKSNSIILIKGSRSMKMEDMIEDIQNY